MTFASLGLSEPIIRALTDKGYTTPSPIQQKAIPVVIQGHDLMASAQTGTGKTAGFTLPLLQKLSEGHKARSNSTRALVITPTRELASQVHDNVQYYSKYLDLKSAVVFGGVKINPQMKKLRGGVDLLIATPGRLLDLHQQNAIKLSDVQHLVLDEADRMLDMGFIHDIKKIQSLLPKRKQTLLFSATFSDPIRKLAKSMLRSPVEVDVSPKNSTVNSVQQTIHPVDKKRKTKLLSRLIRQNDWSQVLVFSRTKHGANRLVRDLDDDGILATAIHGNKSQSQRTKALSDFKKGKVNVLVATDIAARGIDIAQLPQVVNFDLPNVPEDYVHRIGRTGRAGSQGKAYSLVSADEIKQLQDIERLIRKNIDREEIEGFEPKHTVPASLSVAKSAKPKPAKAKSTKPKSTKKFKPKSPAGKSNTNKTTGKKTDLTKPKFSKKKKPETTKKFNRGSR